MVSRLITKAEVFAALLILAGGAVLLGWQFRIPLMRGDFDQPGIAPNAALLFIVAGLALCTSRVSQPLARYGNYFFSLFIVLFAGLTIVEYASHRSFGID